MRTCQATLSVPSHSLWLALLVLFLSGLAGISHAAGELDTKTLSAQLGKIEQTLKRRYLAEDTLQNFASQLTNLKAQATRCIADLEPQQNKLKTDLESLGEPTRKEPADVKRKRLELKNNLTRLEQQLASCHVLALRSDELLGKVDARIKQILARRILARGPDIVSLLEENWDKPSLWFAASEDFIRKHSGLNLLSRLHWVLLLLLLVLTLAPAIWLRRFLGMLIEQASWTDDFSSRFSHALLTTLNHYLPHLLSSTAMALLIYFLTRELTPLPFITVVAIGLPPYFLFVVLVRLLLSPPAPARPFLDMPVELARALAQRLQVLAMLTFIGYLLFATLLSQSLPEPALLIARGIFAGFLILNLIWAFSLLMRFPGLTGRHWLTTLVHLILVIALIAEWMGYRNLSVLLARGMLGSLLALGGLWLLGRLLREFYDNLDQGRHPWNQRLRALLGLKPEDPFPGLLWLRLGTIVGLWLLFGYILLQVWDVSETITRQIAAWITQGFTIGSLKFVPTRIATALLTFVVILVVGSWLRKRMQNRWLLHTHMERGAREATVTMTGYAFFAIALLVALGVAGFDFGSLALIAGALSVGIGFGLQNIVNNFISGLILLFERPIKTGDWIVVGNTEGYVKRIRIRSTQIQTFDQADVLVPNSELISSQVTNWMLKDPRGRIRVPVGVAYGSDTAQVRDILVQVAEEHPRVVNDGSSPRPRVLFREFGDSSLNFELRCFIQNIDERMRITSDLNFAIDKAFREAGIEIPFPQRDIHVRDLPQPPPGTAGDKC